MALDCIENIVPVLQIDSCKGKRIPTTCVNSATPFTTLNLPANTTLDVILSAFLTAINSLNTRMTQQEALILNLQTRVIVLEQWN